MERAMMNPNLTLPSLIDITENAMILQRTPLATISKRSNHLEISKSPDRLNSSLDTPVDVTGVHSRALRSLLGSLPGAPKRKRANLTLRDVEITDKSSSLGASPHRTLKKIEDGLGLLKKEIITSNLRVKSLQAGKALQNTFDFSVKQYVKPNKEIYTRSRLGSPAENKDFTYNGRKFYHSYVNSSRKDLNALPSLKEFLVKTGVKRADRDKKDSLEYILNKLDMKMKRQTDPSVEMTKPIIRPPKRTYKNLTGKVDCSSFATSLFKRYSEFDNKKHLIRKRLKDSLATLSYDRAESVSLKQKNFSLDKDISQMRIEAEKERKSFLRKNKHLINWYSEILNYIFDKITDITPPIYYMLDYIRGLIAEGFSLSVENVKEAANNIPIQERNRSLEILMNKIFESFPE